MNVDGTSSLWDNSGTLTVGGLGAGTLNITSQGKVETTDAIIGSANLPSSNGTVNVTGTGSLWENSSVQVGSTGQGSLTIANGGMVLTLDFATVGSGPEGSGIVSVSGLNSYWETFGGLVIGQSASAEGDLNILGGGKVKSIGATIGRSAAGKGHVTVDGVGSVWEYSGSSSTFFDRALTVGNLGDGTLEITGGGRVISTAALGFVDNLIGSQTGSTGVVRVIGDGSEWEAGSSTAMGHITVGKEGNGTLEVSGGGVVDADLMTVGEHPTSNSMVTVTGSGALLRLSGGPLVGKFGKGTLAVSAGAEVQCSTIFVSGPSTSPSVLTVDGPGSLLDHSSDLLVGASQLQGFESHGSLTISGGGQVMTGEEAFVGALDEARGTATVTGAGSTWQIGDRLLIGLDLLGTIGRGTVRIQSGGAVVTGGSTQVSINSLLSLEGGTLSTAAIDFSDLASADTHFQWTALIVVKPF